MNLHSNPSTSYDIWHYTWKLIHMRLVLLISGIRRSKLRRKIGLAFLTIFILGIVGFLVWLSWFLLDALKSPVLKEYIDPQLLITSIPTLVVTIAFVSMLMVNLGVVLQSLYLAGDMDFLLSTPTPMRAVFLTKLLQAILPNFGFLCLIGLPVLFGLGISSGYNFLYYPLVIISIAVLSLAAAGVSSILVMAIVRVFPARRVAEVLSFAGVIISVLCGQSSRLFSDIEMSHQQISGGLNALAKFNSPWSPFAWIGRGLVAVGEGQEPASWLLLVFSLALAGLLFYLTLVLSERLYYSGWASLQNITSKKKKNARQHEVQAPTRPGLERFIPSPVRALVLKDFILLRRDLRHLSQLIMPVIYGGIYILLMFRGGDQPDSVPKSPIFAFFFQNILLYSAVGLSMFVCWSFINNMTLPAFSREGKNFWLIRTAPVNHRQLLLAKYLVSFLPSLALGCVFLLVILFVQHADLSMTGYCLTVIVFSSLGLNGLMLAFGVNWAKLDWEDPRQMGKGTGGCLGFIASAIFLILSLIFFFGPPLGTSLLGWGEATGQGIGVALGCIFCLAGGFIPLRLVEKKISTLGTE